LLIFEPCFLGKIFSKVMELEGGKL